MERSLLTKPIAMKNATVFPKSDASTFHGARSDVHKHNTRVNKHPVVSTTSAINLKFY